MLTGLVFAAAGLVSVCGLAQTPQPDTTTHGEIQNQEIATRITGLFNEDQTVIAALQKAKDDEAFARKYKIFAQQVSREDNNPNFNDPLVFEKWADQPDAPAIVRQYVPFRKATNAIVRSIVEVHGWPQRAVVGDEAAAEFFFLFGHADDDNLWRLSQLPTIRRVAREDHLNPRMYAHLCDRLANVAGKPQIYGTVMGPGESPGTAKLYWPLEDGEAAADLRRAQIGLPTIEDDLNKFRHGAVIGPYMTPITKGMEWSLADVYQGP